MMEGNFEKAHTLIQEYNEATATFMFTKALLHFKENGMTKVGIKLLAEANEANSYVIDYLLGGKPIPHKRPDYVGFEDEAEAVAYVQGNASIWTDAETFLKKVK